MIFFYNCLFPFRGGGCQCIKFNLTFMNFANYGHKQYINKPLEIKITCIHGDSNHG